MHYPSPQIYSWKVSPILIVLLTRPSFRSFKKRAPSAVKAIVAFAAKTMGTQDVRVDPKLNKAVWSKGIKNVPHRVRVRLDRKRNDDDEAKHKLYTVVTFVPTLSFKGNFSMSSSNLYSLF